MVVSKWRGKRGSLWLGVELQTAGMGWVGEDLRVNSSTSTVTLNSGNEPDSLVGASVVESGSCGDILRVLSKMAAGTIVSRDCLICGNSVGWKDSWGR